MNPMCDHLSCREAQCPDCGFQVDAYGNVDDGSGRLEYCCFPDCGCDGRGSAWPLAVVPWRPHA